jgi:hypothetical protein
MSHADESTMAGKEPPHPDEKDGLSSRIRDLILVATVEERRKPKSRKRSGPNGEQRRRTDQASEEKRAS